MSTAVATPPPVVEAPTTFRERMQQATAQAVASGGVDGVVTEDMKKVADDVAKKSPKAEIDKAAEVKVDPKATQKVEVKLAAKEEPKKEEPTNPFDALDKLRGDLPEIEKIEEEKAKGAEAKPKEEYTFKKLREERDSYQKELNEIKAKVGDTDVPSLKKQLEDAQKIIDEKSKRLASLDAMEDPMFQREVATPCRNIIDSLQADAKDYGFGWKEFAEAVSNPDRKARAAALDAVLSSSETNIPNLEKSDIVSRVSEYLQRQDYGAKILAQAEKFNEASKIERSKKEKEESSKKETDFKRVSEIVFDHMTGDDMLKQMPFLQDENGKLDTSKAELIKIANRTGELSHGSRAIDAYSSAILQMALPHIKGQDTKIADLHKRIAELSAAGPGMGTSAGASEATGDDGLSFADKMKKIRDGR